jgi:hypothetical protein
LVNKSPLENWKLLGFKPEQKSKNPNAALDEEVRKSGNVIGVIGSIFTLISSAYLMLISMDFIHHRWQFLGGNFSFISFSLAILLEAFYFFLILTILTFGFGIFGRILYLLFKKN